MPERTNVLYVIWSLQTGGAERVVADLARSLDRNRFRPMVCCLNFKGRLALELEAEGIPVFAVDKKRRADLGALFRLARLMRREHVHVVHTHLWTSSLWGRLAALLARVPVRVVTEHNIDTWRGRGHLFVDRILARFTHHFVFVSQEVASFYRAHLPLVADDRCLVVHNGIDRVPFEQTIDRNAVRDRMGLPREAVVAGVVGRLDERKGHRYFLEAMKRLAGEPGLHAVVVGEGREKDALFAQRRELGLEPRVHLVGYWASLAEALAAIDLFVLPSLMEGHPLAILEAMAAGKPVVATRVGGNHEAVDDGRSGLLVPPRDAEALAEAISSLARDSERAARMGLEGRRLLGERFSLEAAVRANEQIYLKHLGDPIRGGENGR
ncbi:MAG TPA: glycosyltransferase [Vicinamibacteria bacterium]|nr:glycosyltransferase [Vicinamibacteria bacterium]